MISTRAALALPAAVLVLSGCGAAATRAPRTTTVSVSLPATAPALPKTALLRPLPVIPVAPTYDVATVAAGGANEWLEILTPSGTMVARTEIDPTGSPAVGAGGAYWTENGAEYELTPAGAIHKLGSVPSDAGGVVIAPDGVSFAYGTSDTLSNGNLVNHLVVVHPGEAPQMITDKGAPTQAQVNAMGYNWSYSLFSWTSAGIAFARTPQGMCGCGSFDMQMQSAYSAIIDPVSDGEITLTASTSCPLSDLGPALESVCFDTNANTGATDEIRIATAGTVTHMYTLSGKNAAGDAMFSADGSQLAYVTIPVAQADECGGSDFTVTLRMMDIATGDTVDREMGNFAPSGWSGGVIFGAISSASGDTSYLVAVNTTTLAVTRLTPSDDSAATIGVM
jgi:hypothetical protein